jgi:hypothetical protein
MASEENCCIKGKCPANGFPHTRHGQKNRPRHRPLSGITTVQFFLSLRLAVMFGMEDTKFPISVPS